MDKTTINKNKTYFVALRNLDTIFCFVFAVVFCVDLYRFSDPYRFSAHFGITNFSVGGQGPEL